jgi:hypothetical protein
MQQWMGEERAFAVKAYYQNGEILVPARRAFRTHFNVPRNRAIKTGVANFKVSGQQLKKEVAVKKLCELQRTLRGLRRIHTYHAVTMPLPCRYHAVTLPFPDHAVLLRL